MELKKGDIELLARLDNLLHEMRARGFKLCGAMELENEPKFRSMSGFTSVFNTDTREVYVFLAFGFTGKTLKLDEAIKKELEAHTTNLFTH